MTTRQSKPGAAKQTASKKIIPSESVKVKAILARRELARRRMIHFVQTTFPQYQAGWVHHDICQRLEKFSRDVAEGKSPRLMLLMPPRHGKSQLASQHFPAWHLGQYPQHEVINVGYNLDLPTLFSRRVRELMRSPAYKPIFPGARIDPKSQGVEAWNTVAGGGFTAAGVGGGITGKGAHILIVDDPIKNQEEADSILVRDKLEDWYQSTAYTRLAPGGGVLLIETWWNDDDLAGRLQAAMKGGDEDADQFEVVRYPALATHFEYRNEETLEIVRLDRPALPTEIKQQNLTHLRDRGEGLHLERYPTEALRRIKGNLHPRIWSALYQQNPVPDEGMYFRKEDFRFQASMPTVAGMHVFTAWDFAIGEKQANDWTVGATILQDEFDRLYVLDICRIKGGTDEICQAMIDVAKNWGQIPQTGYLVGVEDGQIWRSIEPVLRRMCQEQKTEFPMEQLRPLSDKAARARPLQGRMQHGRVIFPENAPWLDTARTELLRFPAGAHDDIVDALAWAVRLALQVEAPKRAEEPTPKSWKDKLTLLGQATGSHMSA